VLWSSSSGPDRGPRVHQLDGKRHGQNSNRSIEERERRDDAVGKTPAKLKATGVTVYKFVSAEKLAERIEEAALAAGK
jgi:hypothetical protein